MTNQRRAHINLDHAFELLSNGVRRADIFMGIGLNAARHDPPISHLLTADGLHTIQLVKETLTADEQAHVSEEFSKWVRGNGLRELIETVSLFIDRLYIPLFIIHRKRIQTNIPIPSRFERLGIADKLSIISLLFPVNDADRKALASLNQARNCYAHRRGVIGNTDISLHSQSLTVYWSAFQIEVHEPNGNILVDNDILNRIIEHGGTVCAQLVERTRTFSLGAELVLEKQELKEICLHVLSIGQRLMFGTAEAAKAAGIWVESDLDEKLNHPKLV